MNFIFRTVWNHTLGRLVVASEAARSRVKGSGGRQQPAPVVTTGSPLLSTQRPLALAIGLLGMSIAATTATAQQNVTYDNVVVTEDLTVSGEAILSALQVSGNAAFSGSLTVGGVDVATATDIDGLDTRVGDNETAITGLGSDIDGLDTRVGDNETAITGLGSDIDGLDTRVGDNEGAITGLGTDIGALDTRVGDNETAIDGLGTSITTGTVTADSVTTGNTSIDNDGLTITGGPSVTSSGIDAGELKIINLAEGNIVEDSTDAVTGGQLYDFFGMEEGIEGVRYFRANSTKPDSNPEGLDSIAIGPEAKTTEEGEGAIALGLGAEAGGVDEGSGGAGAIAIGRDGVASGTSSVALGDGANAAAGNATALGAGSVASGGNSIALGQAQAVAGNSFAAGTGAFAGSPGGIALGTDAGVGTEGTEAGDKTHHIAIGTSAGRNVDGNQTTAVGYQAGSNVTGDHNVAVGSHAGEDIQGYFNVAIGHEANRNAGAIERATAVGGQSDAGRDGVSVGYGAQSGDSGASLGANATAGNMGVALGRNASADGGNVALGSSSAARSIDAEGAGYLTGSNFSNGTVVSVGNTNPDGVRSTRRVVNVADGAQGYDAVNVRQLQGAQQEVANLVGGSVTVEDNGAFGGYIIELTDAGDATHQYSTVAEAINAVSSGEISVLPGDAVIYNGNGTVTVAEGVVGTDAVNVEQLNAAIAEDGVKYFDVNSVEPANRDNTQANGTDAIAIGPATSAEGRSSLAAGHLAHTVGDQSVALGFEVEALGDNSTAIGSSSDAYGDGAVAIGLRSISQGENSIVMGTDAQADPKNTDETVDNAIVIGTDAEATADNGIAVGEEAIASEVRAVAQGYQAHGDADDAQAFGTRAHASGVSSQASGTDAAASGENAQASGTDASASGMNTQASGTRAIGYATDGIAMGTDAVSGFSDPFNQDIERNTAGIAIGKQSLADEQHALAVGVEARARAASATAIGDGAEATADASNALAVGAGARVTADSAAAFGHDAEATAAQALASGAGAQATAEGASAIGQGANAMHEGSVALGSGAETAAPESTASHTVDKVTYDYAGIAPVATVSVGAPGQERTLTNVAAGRVSETSTDAINGSQLYGTNVAVTELGENLDTAGASVASVLGGDAAYDPDTHQVTMSNVGGTGENTVDGAIEYAAQGWYLSANGEGDSGFNVEPGQVANFDDGQNIELSRSGDTISVATAENVTFSDVQTDSLTAGPVSINSGGINAGNTTISNLADGTADDHAVNLGQLEGAAAAATSEVAGGTNIASVDQTTGADGQAIYTVNADGASVSAGSGAVEVTDSNAGDNVTDYGVDLSQDSKESLTLADSALQEVVTQINGTEVKTIDQDDNVANFKTGSNIELTDDAGSIEIATADNVTFSNVQTDSLTAGPVNIDAGGINAGDTTISGVADGVANDHAVNLGQLEGAAAAATSEVAGGTNIASVDQTTGADGQAIYEVNADGASVSAGSGAVAVTDSNAGDNVTDYAVDLSQASKNSLDLADSALQTVVTQVDGTEVKTLDENDNVANFKTGSNIELTDDAGSIEIATADNVTFTDVQTDTLTAGPININAGGINAGDTTISGVADGVANDHAVNFGQLEGAAAAAKSEVTGGTNIASVDQTTGADGQAIYEVNAEGASVSAGSGAVAVTDSDVGDNVTDYAVDLSQASKNSLDLADSALQTVVTQIDGTEVKTLDENDNVANFIGGQNVELTDDAGSIEIATSADLTADSLTISNGPIVNDTGINMGGDTITNLGDGVNDTDAVNVSQLNSLADTPLTFAGDAGADVERQLGETLNLTGGESDEATLTEGNIGVVADGSDTLSIQLAENVDLGEDGSVTTGDTVMNTDGITVNDGTGNTTEVGAGTISVAGGGNSIAIDGSEGTIGGLANRDFDPDNIVNGQAATEDQLGQVSDVANAGWNVSVDDEGALADGSNNVGPEGVVDFSNPDGNIDIARDGTDLEFALNENIDLGEIGSVTTGDTVMNTDGLAIDDGAGNTTTTTVTGTTVADNAGNETVVDASGVAVGDDVTLGDTGLEIAGGPSVTTGGIDAGDQVITGVNAGVNDTDAVNVSQLNSLADTPLTFAGDAGTDVERQLGETLNLVGGADEATLTDGNIGVVADGSDTLSIQLAENVDLGEEGSVTTGDTVMNTDGVTVNDGTGSTTEVGAGTISVAGGGNSIAIDGSEGTIGGLTNRDFDPDNIVNGQAATEDQLGQVSDVANAGWNVSVDDEGALADSSNNVGPEGVVDFSNPDGNIDIARDGTDLEFALNENIDLGETGSVTTGDTVMNTDGLAIDDGAGNTTTTTVTGTTVADNAGNETVVDASGVAVGDDVTLGDTGLEIAGGPSVTTGGIDAGDQVITGVNAGVNDTDAVNVSQLNSLADTPLTFAGDAGTDVERQLGETLNLTGGESDEATLTDGNIGVVADGSDTLSIQLAENVDLGEEGSVTTGDTVMNTDGVTVNDGTGNTTEVGAGTISVAGAGNTITIDGSAGTIGGLENQTIDYAEFADGSGRAASEEQLSEVDGALGELANTPITFGGDSGETDRRLGDSLDIVGSNDNLSTEMTDDETLEIALNDDLALDSVTTGDTVMNTDGVSVGDDVQLSGAGLAVGDTSDPLVASTQVEAGTITLVANPTTGPASTISIDANSGTIEGLTNQTIDYPEFADNSGRAATEEQLSVVNETANLGWDVSANGEDAENVAPGDTVDFSNEDGNIVIEHEGTNLLFNLADAITADSLTAGDTVIDTTGLVIADGPSITVNGIDAGGQAITNVAPGLVSENSSDAINGSQLWDVEQVANAGWNLTTNGDADSQSNVTPDDTVDFSADGNVLVSNEGNEVSVALADTITLGEDESAVTVNGEDGFVSVGDTMMNGDGIQVGNNVHLDDTGLVIAGGPSVTVSGINAGGMQVTGVGSGLGGQALHQVSGDELMNAVNVGDLQGVASDIGENVAAAKTEVVEGGNISVTQSTGENGQDIYTVETQRDVDFDSIEVGSVNIDQSNVDDEGNTIIAGVGRGEVSESSTDAVNGSQLHDVAQQVGDIGSELDGGMNFGADEGEEVNRKLGDTVAVRGDDNITTNTISNDDGVGIEVTLNRELDVDSVTAGGTVVSDQGVTIEDGPSMTVDGIDGGGQRITNVAPGVDATDAVNVGQMQELNQRFANEINNVHGRINEVGKNANAGTASALAAGTVPQAWMPGKSMVGVGAGNYEGESAVSVGISRMSDNGRWIIQGKVTGDSQSNFGAGVGAGWHW